MRKGKFAAQAGHASMMFILDRNGQPEANRKIEVTLTKAETEWCHSGFAKVVLGCGSEEELLALIDVAEQHGIQAYPIIDNGLTEFHGVKTLTCAAFGPDYSDVLDKITGHLKLL